MDESWPGICSDVYRGKYDRRTKHRNEHVLAPLAAIAAIFKFKQVRGSWRSRDGLRIATPISVTSHEQCGGAKNAVPIEAFTDKIVATRAPARQTKFEIPIGDQIRRTRLG